jgi:hypothetical protein
MMSRCIRSALSFAAALAGLSSSILTTLPAGATQTDWKLTMNGNFSTASNCDNGVPDSSKTSDVGLGLGIVSYTVTYNGAASGFPPPEYQAYQLIVNGTNNVTFVRNSLQPVAPA